MLRSHHFSAVGNLYHHFKVTKLQEIPELHCTLVELIHLPTEAKVMYIANDDPENVFCLSFQTTPNSSNGVAHVLEHTVLCGSKKFPVKDPFFSMHRRSLNTFMNAFTGADFTCYPAASQVPTDFYNLLDVYIDAVFHPTLKELSFAQEGHRLEFATPSDPNSALEYKGIVFNEMKGAMATAGARLSEEISKALFPDITYGVNSGGDPQQILKLTYQELLDFHKTYYHPSRCLFFFYGNMPLEGHLDFIAKHILNDTISAPPLPAIPLQKRYSKPCRLTKKYPLSEEESPEEKTEIAFSWLTCHLLNQEEILALCIVQLILLDTDGSSLKRALLKSGLCKQVLSYMDDEISEVPFIITVKGCNPSNAQKLERIIRTELTGAAEEGFPLDKVENAIHQLEFHRSEITGNHYPFGLSLFMRSALLKQHGGEPEDGLIIHSLCERIRKKNIENPGYFGHIIRKHLLDNPHFVRITIVPDKDLQKKEMEKEKKALKKVEKKLTKQQRKDIVEQSKQLEALQKSQEEENPDILPKVTLRDVPTRARLYELAEGHASRLKTFHHTTFTNNIVYADLVFDLPKIKESDLPYVRLLSTLISQVGSGGRDYIQNLEYIQAHTGGAGSGLSFNLQAADFAAAMPSIALRSKALNRKMSHLFPLLKELALTADFADTHRLKEIINKQYTGMQSHFTQNAMKYATSLSAAGLDVPSKISNIWYGIEYYQLIKSLAQDFASRSADLVKRLKHLQQAIFLSKAPDLIITSDGAAFNEIQGHHFFGVQDPWDKLGKASYAKWDNDYSLEPVSSQGRVISSPVAFISQVIRTVPFTHSDSAALTVAGHLMDNLYLHRTIREQGGAYGGGASSSPLAGNFYFYSYRDPNIYSSLKAFKNSVDEVLKGKFLVSDIFEAQLEVVQALDSPVAPGSRGDLAYAWMRESKTLEVRQAFRDKLLSLKKADILKAIEQHIQPHLPGSAAIVFAGKELLEQENQKFIAANEPPLLVQGV